MGTSRSESHGTGKVAQRRRGSASRLRGGRLGSAAWGFLLSLALVLAACSGGATENGAEEDSETAVTSDEETGSESEGDPDGGTEGEEPDAAAASTVRIATSSEPPSMDAHRVGSGPVMDLYANLFDTLVDFEPDGTMVPELAAELPEQVEDDRWRIQLREGVTFHNGDPFDADAAIVNIERMLDPDIGSVFLESIETITAVEKVDEHTVEIVTDGFDVVLPRRLFYVQMIAPSSIENDTLDDEAIGTGPYVVESWDRGSSITLERNEDYWGDAPSIETAEFRFLPEAGTRVAALLSGEVDVITGLPPDDRSQVPQAAPASDKAAVIAQMHCEDGMVTTDQRVRQAMIQAIDRQAIAEQLYLGDADVLNAVPIAPGWFGYDDDAPGYDYAPDAAAALVEEAGATGGNVRIVYDAGRWPRVDEIAQILTSAWGEIGLNVELDNQQGEAWIDVLLGRVPYSEIVMVQAGNEFFDASLVAGKYLNPESGRVTCGNDALSGLLNDAVSTTDEAEREASYEEAWQLIHENAWSIPVVAAPGGLVGMIEDVTWTPGVEARTVVADMSLTR